ncbi:MAG: PP2C family protein-serine/threonine phosphatase [Bacteroidota bacterium]
MQELADRIVLALSGEEAKAEQFANNVRILLLAALTSVASLNAASVSFEANVLNFTTLTFGYMYGFLVFVLMRKAGYHPSMKYITSCLDVVLVFFVLSMYTTIEIPSVALKNYVFLTLFPLIALTTFRYDARLTIVAGGLAVLLYLSLFIVLSLSGAVVLTHGGYAQELFSQEVTWVGQGTKVLILGGYVLLLSYLARYSHRLFAKLVANELSVRHEKELMDSEMKVASQVQMLFLPHSFPEVRGLEIYGAVQQGRFVGGDYFDFIKLTDQTLLVVAADVSGNGVPAALIMAEVRAATQLLTSMSIDLENLVQRLNTLVYQSTDKKNFVTLFAAEIDTSQHSISYVNAGHPPPVVCFDRNVRSLARGTLPLGVNTPLPNLIKHTEEFLPGTLLVSYTDGIVERTDSHQGQYGEERLLQYIQRNAHRDVRVFVEELFAGVREFGQGKELDDDATLAAVKYLG